MSHEYTIRPGFYILPSLLSLWSVSRIDGLMLTGVSGDVETGVSNCRYKGLVFTPGSSSVEATQVDMVQARETCLLFLE